MTRPLREWSMAYYYLRTPTRNSTNGAAHCVHKHVVVSEKWEQCENCTHWRVRLGHKDSRL